VWGGRCAHVQPLAVPVSFPSLFKPCVLRHGDLQMPGVGPRTVGGVFSVRSLAFKLLGSPQFEPHCRRLGVVRPFGGLAGGGRERPCLQTIHPRCDQGPVMPFQLNAIPCSIEGAAHSYTRMETPELAPTSTDAHLTLTGAGEGTCAGTDVDTGGIVRAVHHAAGGGATLVAARETHSRRIRRSATMGLRCQRGASREPSPSPTMGLRCQRGAAREPSPSPTMGLRCQRGASRALALTHNGATLPARCV
jgi:hypothetical protein